MEEMLFSLSIIPTSASCFATPDIIHSFICWTSTCLHLVTHLLETFVPIHCSPVGYSFTEPLTVSSVMFTLISYTQPLTHQRHPRLLWSSILIYSHLLFAHLMNKHLQHSLSRHSHQFIHHTYLLLHHSFINTYPPFLSFNTYYPLPNLSLLYMYLHLLNAHSLISSMLYTLSSIIQISVHSANFASEDPHPLCTLQLVSTPLSMVQTCFRLSPSTLCIHCQQSWSL